MFEEEKEMLKRLCVKTNPGRQAALENELKAMGVHYDNLDDLTLVVPAKTDRKVVLSAHYDVVPGGSYGYNDNGMALVTVLKMMGQLPQEAEVVFTNLEEWGSKGAKHYLEHTDARQILGCVNLDVVGCFDQVYLDPMDFAPARGLTNCKQGDMPRSDARAFAEAGVPAVCFSTGPSDTDFDEGIKQIWSTIHNNEKDNRFDILNFEMIGKVAAEALKVIRMMTEA